MDLIVSAAKCYIRCSLFRLNKKYVYEMIAVSSRLGAPRSIKTFRQE